MQNLWYFNTGSFTPILTSGNVYYYQAADLVFNTNCGSSDVCDETPQWSLTTDNSQTHLGSTSGTTVTIFAGPNNGNCDYDSALSASIGGFSTDSYAIAVNSPTSLVSQASLNSTAPFGTGYQSQVYWHVADACSPANVLLSVPMRETFSGFSNPGVISGWPDPAATSAAAFNHTATEWYDTIAASGPYNPAPTYTSSNPPFTYNTVIKTGGQKWYMGSQAQGAGVEVFNGTITYYRDHGTSQ